MGWFDDEYVPTVRIVWSEQDQCYTAGIEGTKLCLRLHGDTADEAYENGKEAIEFFLSNISEIDGFVDAVPSYGR